MAEVYCFTDKACDGCGIKDLRDLAESLTPIISDGIDATEQFGPSEFHETSMSAEALLELNDRVRGVAPGRAWDVSHAVNRHATRLCAGIVEAPSGE